VTHDNDLAAQMGQVLTLIDGHLESQNYGLLVFHRQACWVKY